MSEDLIRFTKSSSDLTKQLVIYAQESKRSADHMEILTWVLVGFTFFQVLFLLWQNKRNKSAHIAVIRKKKRLRRQPLAKR